METAYATPAHTQTPANPEHLQLTEVPLSTIEALGHAAANAALQSTLKDGAYVSQDSIEAAHEAAIVENQIFDIYDTAHKEHEVFKAHEAALEEDEQRAQAAAEAETEAKTVAIEPKQPQKSGEATDSADNPDTEQTHNTLAPASPAELRREATEALKQAGLTAQIRADSQVSRDLDGNLLVMSGHSATVIARLPGNVTKVTAYDYDKDTGTLTVTAGGLKALTGHVLHYRSTELQDWQTNERVITLPPTIAKRFGIEQAVVVE